MKAITIVGVTSPVTLIGSCLVLILKPLDISPTIFRNVRRQDTRSVSDALICLAVLAFILQPGFGKVKNSPVFPLGGPSPTFGSFGYVDLNRTPALARQILFDNDLRDSQDAIAPTTPGLGFAEINDSRHLREPSNDSIFAALQDCSDIADS
jgi:hypothetical protein